MGVGGMVDNLSFLNVLVDVNDPDMASAVQFGPYGLGFIIDGLRIAFTILPNVSSPDPPLASILLLCHNLLKFVNTFKADSTTPGYDIHSPPAFRRLISTLNSLETSKVEYFSVCLHRLLSDYLSNHLLKTDAESGRVRLEEVGRLKVRL